MTDSVSWTFYDFDKQAGIFGINVVERTAANFAAQEALLLTLQGTLDEITNGLVGKRTFNSPSTVQPGIQSADPLSQRGNKWLIQCLDVTTELAAGVPNPSYLKPFSYEIPTADLLLRVDHDDEVWVQGGSGNVADFDPFVTAFEAVAKSPNGGVLAVQAISSVTRSGG